MTRIELNADMGEGAGDDLRLMALIDRANIACGGHAGDAATMATALAQAAEHGVKAGAHPSYPDKAHFGRRTMRMPADALRESLREQIYALKAVARKAGVPLDHVKPHGALYNDAAGDADLAALVADATRAAGISTLLGPPGSCLAAAAKAQGLAFLAEGFADRAYLADGRLAPRGTDGAVIDDPAAAASQVRAMATGAPIPTSQGGSLTISVQTICVHGDGPHASAIAAAARAAIDACAL